MFCNLLRELLVIGKLVILKIEVNRKQESGPPYYWMNGI